MMASIINDLIDVTDSDTDDIDHFISNYIIEEEMHSFFNPSITDSKTLSFTLLQVNCRSLKANYSSLMNIIESSNASFSAIAVTETWLNETNEDVYQIDGYKFIPKNRSGMKSGGGVGYYIKNCFNTNILNELSIAK